MILASSTPARHWPAWLNPAAVILGFTGSLSLITAGLPDSVFEEWGVEKFFDRSHLLLAWVGIGALVIGIMIGSTRTAAGTGAEAGVLPHHDPEGRHHDELLEKWYRGAGILVVGGYLAWLVIGLARGVSIALFQDVLDRDLGAISSLKGYLAPVGGVTTLTQLAGIVSAIGAHRFCSTRRIGGLWIFVVAAGAFRALFYAERLALMEVLIPAGVVLVLEAGFFTARRRLTRWLPAFGLGGLVVVFAASEYFRSWIFYADVTDLPFHRWVLLRLVGYYATAFNNNALFHDLGSSVGHDPYYSFPFAYDFPGVSAIFGRPEVGGADVSDWWMGQLQLYANEEFNNTGSFLVPMADLGVVGGALFWVIAGIVIGRIYQRARSGCEVGVIGYSVIFLGLLELPRFVYWTQGRFFPAVVAIALMIGHDRPGRGRVTGAGGGEGS